MTDMTDLAAAEVKDLILLDDKRIAEVPVEDCGDPLIDLRTLPWLEVDGRQADTTGSYARVRTGLVRRLRGAQDALPAGYRLVIVEGYRPPELQRRYYDEHLALLRARRPDWSPERLRALAVQYVAPPEVAPHTTGGAIDVTLRGPDGELCWMGTEMNTSPDESDRACYTDADNVSYEGRAHRRVLGAALSAAGFVNYPTEWWHWSYGDPYWAFVTGAAFAPNGPLSEAP